MLGAMSNYGQQPPYGQNPGQPNPYGSPQPPAGQPPQQYGQPPQPYGQPAGPRPGQPPYGQPNPYAAPGGQYPPQQPYGQPGPAQPGGQPPPYGQPPQPQWTPQPPVAKKPAIVPHAIPVVTMDILPGEEIAEVVGDVIGVVARTRELRPDLRNGNPVDGYVTMLTESRQDAVTRLVEMAQSAGADAVVGLRFDCSEITQSLSEVAAYGTAVKLVRATEEPATPESQESADQTASASGGQPVATSDSSGDQSAGQQWPPRSWPSSS
jgi:uncharacterized protein YbjQ (UPF0145 family)